MFFFAGSKLQVPQLCSQTACLHLRLTPRLKLLHPFPAKRLQLQYHGAVLPHPEAVSAACCDPSPVTKARPCSDMPLEQVWDIERGRVITALPSPSIINTVAFLKDAGVVVSGHQNGTLRFIDTRAKKSNVHEIAGLHTQGGVCGLAVGSHAGKQSDTSGDDPASTMHLCRQPVNMLGHHTGRLPVACSCLQWSGQYTSCCTGPVLRACQATPSCLLVPADVRMVKGQLRTYSSSCS